MGVAKKRCRGHSSVASEGLAEPLGEVEEGSRVYVGISRLTQLAR